MLQAAAAQGDRPPVSDELKAIYHPFQEAAIDEHVSEEVDESASRIDMEVCCCAPATALGFAPCCALGRVGLRLQRESRGSTAAFAERVNRFCTLSASNRLRRIEKD